MRAATEAARRVAFDISQLHLLGEWLFCNRVEAAIDAATAHASASIDSFVHYASWLRGDVAELERRLEADEFHVTLQSLYPSPVALFGTTSQSYAQLLWSAGVNFIEAIRSQPALRGHGEFSHTHPLTAVLIRSAIGEIAGAVARLTDAIDFDDIDALLDKEEQLALAAIEAPNDRDSLNTADFYGLWKARGGYLTETETEIVDIIKKAGRIVSAADIESELSRKYGDSKTGSVSNHLAFLTRCTILSKGPGGRGYQLAHGGEA